MGVLRPLVNIAQSKSTERVKATSEKIVTLPNAMTLARPLLGLYVGKRLLKGKPRTMPRMFVAGVTDMEGWGARLTDKIIPDSGRGATVIGESADPIADSLLLLEVGGAALLAPRVSMLGKLAVALILAQETRKAAWAITTDRKYRELTGNKLTITTTMNGKEAMAEKILAGGLATWTNDVEHPVAKLVLGVAALGFAVSGALRGHEEFQKYKVIADDMILQAQTPEIMAVA